MKTYFKKKNLLFTFLLFLSINLFAQEDLEKLMQEQEGKPKKEFVTASFKGTRLINYHTVETLGKRTLEFRISHRFSTLNTGANNLWGVEGPATIRLALEYSYNGRLMFGLGRSSAGKLIDAFAKYRILKQTTDNSMPISVTGVASANLTTQKTLINGDASGQENYPHFSDKLAYMAQLIIGRKFSNSFSFQVSPMYIHYNLVPQIMDKNDIFAMIVSGRLKLSKRIALTGEYAFRMNKYSLDYKNYFNSAGLGIDIETGGHVFQIFVTNSYAINEILTIPYTNTTWKTGGIRLGFNITRAFTLGKQKINQ
jgi:hypothetical protein